MYDVGKISDNELKSDIEDGLIVSEFDKIVDGKVLTCTCGYTKSTSRLRRCSYCKSVVSKGNTEKFIKSTSCPM